LKLYFFLLIVLVFWSMIMIKSCQRRICLKNRINLCWMFPKAVLQGLLSPQLESFLYSSYDSFSNLFS
jgi:hypothetical protein